MRAPAAMTLFKTKGKRRGRARFVAAALQKASICTPKLGYWTSLTAVLRGSPPGLRRARAFSAMAPPVRLGDFAQDPTRARTLCFPVQKKTRFKPHVRKWYRLVFALPFPLCRLSYVRKWYDRYRSVSALPSASPLCRQPHCGTPFTRVEPWKPQPPSLYHSVRAAGLVSPPSNYVGVPPMSCRCLWRGGRQGHMPQVRR